jgi:hypothetical protein
MSKFTVIVCAATGAHYECASYSEARDVFENAPVAEDGERLLIITINGAILRREYLEVWHD